LWSFWLKWLLTALSFPVGGGVAFALAGSATSPLKGALAGAIAGAVIGIAQWLVLRQFLSSGVFWILASGIGLAAGLGLGLAVLGARTDTVTLLLRAALTGAVIGLLQWLLLRQEFAMAGWWILAMTIFWVLGWAITRAVGVDLSKGWAVFGISGAIVFAALSGILVVWLIRHPVP
jgi:hypothetical protein